MPKGGGGNGGGNKAPTSVLLSSLIVDENDLGAVIGTLSALDPNKKDTITFSVVDPTSTSPFEASQQADGTWALQLEPGSSLDYEALIGGTTNVDVMATDAGGLSKTQTFTISVNNLPEDPLPLPDNINVIVDTLSSSTIGGTTGVDVFVFDLRTYPYANFYSETIVNFETGRDVIAFTNSRYPNNVTTDESADRVTAWTNSGGGIQVATAFKDVSSSDVSVSTGETVTLGGETYLLDL
jgi:hypothetical protein